jgi:hypothetical protein
MLVTSDALIDSLARQAERWVRAGNYQPLSSPTYRPTLVIPSPRLTLRLDEVAVADRGAALDLAPGEARVRDGELIVGCAAGSALVLKRARVVESAGLPSQWSRAVDNLAGGCVSRSGFVAAERDDRAQLAVLLGVPVAGSIDRPHAEHRRRRLKATMP